MKVSFANLVLLAGLSLTGAFVATPRSLGGRCIVTTANKAMQTSSMLLSRPSRSPQTLIPSTVDHHATSTCLQMSETASLGAPKPLFEKLRVGAYFGLWYAFNIAYNIFNKKVLNQAPALTYTVGFLQLFIGLIYVVPLWLSGARTAPKLTASEIKSLIPVTICHALTHLGAIVSLGAGAVSFAHIVKAAEPAVSAFLSAVFVKSFLPIPVYLTLLPVMGGVALASLGELSFSMVAFLGAMISNIASASRGIVGKEVLNHPPGKNMNAMNLYAVMTILSAIFCLPIALVIEGKAIVPTIQAMIQAGTHKKFYWETFISAITYYLYNEVAFLALDSVAPVTHALGNTIKRVVIILTSVVVFGTKLTTQGAIGSATAIGGVLMYSVAKDYFK